MNSWCDIRTVVPGRSPGNLWWSPWPSAVGRRGMSQWFVVRRKHWHSRVQPEQHHMVTSQVEPTGWARPHQIEMRSQQKTILLDLESLQMRMFLKLNLESRQLQRIWYVYTQACKKDWQKPINNYFVQSPAPPPDSANQVEMSRLPLSTMTSRTLRVKVSISS